MYIDFNLKVDRGSYCEYVNRNFQIQTSVFQKKKKTSHPTNQPLTITYSRSPNHAPLFSISCHRSPLLLHYLRTAANSRTHNRSQSLSLPIYIYISIRYIEIVIPGCALPYEISTGRSLLCARGQ